MTDTRDTIRDGVRDTVRDTRQSPMNMLGLILGAAVVLLLGLYALGMFDGRPNTTIDVPAENTTTTTTTPEATPTR